MLLEETPFIVANFSLNIRPSIKDECQEMMRRICFVCAPEPCSALDLLRQTVNGPSFKDLLSDCCEPVSNATSDRMRFIPSGMSSLDNSLRGGFRIGTITEIVGRAGVGKSQMAMQLCVMASCYGQGSVFIDTEKKLSLRRLKEIAHERRRRALDRASANTNIGNGFFHYDDGPIKKPMNHSSGVQLPEKPVVGDEIDYKDPLEVLENVTVHSPGSTQEMLSVVIEIEDEILLRNEEASKFKAMPCSRPAKFPVRLVVLDSIAAPARRDFGIESAPQRVLALFQAAQILKRIADQLRVAVVVINQVGRLGESMSGQQLGPTSGSAHNSTDGSDFVSVTAALGNSWHHCVSTRLLLEHERDPHRLSTNIDAVQEMAMSHFDSDSNLHGRQAWMSDRGHVRKATVVKSNVTGRSSMSFEVTASGVCEMV